MLVHRPILRNARLAPDAVAARCCGEVFGWARFADRVRRLATGLAALGLAPGDRLAVLSGNCHRYLELYYAVPMAGGIIVPLNTRLSPPEIAAITQDCRPWGLAVGPGFDEQETVLERAGVLPGHVVRLGGAGGGGGVGERGATSRDYEELVTSHPASPSIPREDLTDQQIVGIFYTGGTTGLPKGVCLSHRSLTVHAYQVQASLRYRSEDRYLHMAPMFHIADLASTFIISQVAGSHHFMAGFDPAAMTCVIDREAITCTLMVPTMLNLLVQWLEANPHDLVTFRQFLYGGSAIAADRLERALEVLRCRFYQGYGMTEASPTLTLLTDEDHRAGGELLLSAGRPVLGVELRIAGADDGPLPPGSVGEIQARGPNLMTGYWNREEATARALRGGWYHTGDLGRQDERGYLFLMDRLDDRIVTGGENVYSTEVEAVLYRHPDVVEACVVSAPDETWGERIVAVVVRRPGSGLDAGGLRAFCRGRIADFKIPKDVHFRDALPRSGPGKILKRAVRETFWQGKPRRIQ